MGKKQIEQRKECNKEETKLRTSAINALIVILTNIITAVILSLIIRVSIWKELSQKTYGGFGNLQLALIVMGIVVITGALTNIALKVTHKCSLTVAILMTLVYPVLFTVIVKAIVLVLTL